MPHAVGLELREKFLGPFLVEVLDPRTAVGGDDADWIFLNITFGFIAERAGQYLFALVEKEWLSWRLALEQQHLRKHIKPR